MIFSMTGYAAVTDESPLGGLSLDLRSVNHRYLDIQFRMPDELRVLESALRERISARVSELSRGRRRFVHATVVRAQCPTSTRPGDAAIGVMDVTRATTSFQFRPKWAISKSLTGGSTRAFSRNAPDERTTEFVTGSRNTGVWIRPSQKSGAR